MTNFINKIMGWVQLKIFGELKVENMANLQQNDQNYVRKDEFIASMHKETTLYVSSRLSRGSVHLQGRNFIIRREELL